MNTSAAAPSGDLPLRIRKAATDFMSGPANDLHMPSGPEPAFGDPLIGFAAGDDEIWQTFKSVVGEFHWTPAEAFGLAYPGERPRADELSVISWILPQMEATRRDNRKESVYPAERWARARIMGESHVNNGLRSHLVASLQQAGFPACAPMQLPQWERRDSQEYTFSSTWSERHAAYAAGLGTFGLCDGLITPAGKAMRAGSVIVLAKLPAGTRPYKHHREYCLFFNSGICGKCIKRCPVGAISPSGHDKLLCRAHLGGETTRHVKENYGFDGYGCGLCQVGVPCERGIPRPADKKAN